MLRVNVRPDPKTWAEVLAALPKKRVVAIAERYGLSLRQFSLGRAKPNKAHWKATRTVSDIVYYK